MKPTRCSECKTPFSQTYHAQGDELCEWCREIADQYEAEQDQLEAAYNLDWPNRIREAGK